MYEGFRNDHEAPTNRKNGFGVGTLPIFLMGGRQAIHTYKLEFIRISKAIIRMEEQRGVCHQWSRSSHR